MTDRMSTFPRENRLPAYFSLFASLSTLVCCALPSLFVLAGMGASVAAILSAAPWLVALSRQKELVFAVSGLMIAANGYFVYRIVPKLLVSRGVCQPGDESACAAASRFSRTMLLASAAVYVAGFFVAFLLGPILTVFEA